MESYYHEAVYIRVIDGDTIEAVISIDVGFDIKLQLRDKFRLAELDTFELRDSRPQYRKAARLEAKKLKQILFSAEQVFIASHKKGKYGRRIAYLKTSDFDDVNEVMLSYHDFLAENIDDESIDLEDL